jgi:NitT/TauT family transport system substrate-binding protein
MFKRIQCLSSTAVILICLLGSKETIAAQVTASRPNKATISYPAPSISAMVLEIADQKGFYKEEGLDIGLVRVPGTTGVQGMLAGEFDLATNVGTALNASLKAAAFKLIMLNESTLFWLYAKPEINSVAKLKGKKIAMSTRGSLTDINLTSLLQKYEIDPVRDVLKIVITDPGTRLVALHSGSVDAAVLSPPSTVRARTLGLRPVVFFGDEVESIYTGLSTTDKFIREEPEKVQRIVRASLKGLRYLKGNKQGSVALMVKTLRIDEPTASVTYDETIGAFLITGFQESSYLEKIVKLHSRFAQVENPPPTDRLSDFSFIRRANDQLRDWRLPK